MGICVRGVRGWVASCLILGGILVGAGGGTVLSTGAAVAQTVNSIVVEGNRRVEADTIRSYFRPGPGGRLGPEQEDEALKAMVATGLFSDVRISHSGGRIVVTVAENPVINRVAFEGNKKAKDEQLQAETQSKPRGTLSRRRGLDGDASLPRVRVRHTEQLTDRLVRDPGGLEIASGSSQAHRLAELLHQDGARR